MGLVEKRITAAMQKDNFAAWKQRLLDACGIPKLEIVVLWDEMVKEGYGEHYPKTMEWNFIKPLESALESVCADDIGADAFRGRIKKIQLQSKRSWSSLEAKVDGDTLYVDSDPSYGKTEEDCNDYNVRIQKALESAL